MSRPDVNQSDEQRMEATRVSLAEAGCYGEVSPHSFCNTNGPFVRWVNALDPYMSPYFTFESLQRNCLEVYKEEHPKVKHIFSKHGAQISLSVDLLIHEEDWDSIHEYLCLTAHFIDDNWNLQKWVIKYCCESSYDIILKSLKEYGIEGKVSTLTVGGAGDLADCVKEFYHERNFPLDGKLFNVRCIGAVIGHMVKKGFKEIKGIIDKVEELCWSKSLPLWYLTSTKLKDALKLYDSGEFSSRDVVDCYEVPSKKEWDKVRSMCEIADKIYLITKGLFDIKRPTTNLFLPHLQEIRAYLGQESANGDAFVRFVAQKMLEIFNKHFDDMLLVLTISAFLDPRFKMSFVEFCLCDESRATFVLKSICELYGGYTAGCDHKEYLLSNSYSRIFDSEEEEDEEQTEERQGGKEERGLLLGELNVVQEFCKSMPSMYYKAQKTDLVDLDMYLEELVVPWEEDFSVLQWWKENSSKYPQLSKMARDYLAIPMSVATSYEAYYTEQREADRTLLGLEPELMNALKCTRSWILRL